MRSTSPPPENVLGYPVWTGSVSELVEDLRRSMGSGQQCRWLACLNPHSYVVSLDDNDFERALRDADWLIPDGVGIVMASRLHQGRIVRRITGWDVFSCLHDRLQQQGGGRVFLLGASEDTLDIVRARLAREYPAIQVVGSLSPPYRSQFSEEDNLAMIAAVNRSGANVLWVAMTAPKQEKWLLAQSVHLKVDLAFAVGAVFDFYAGKVQRSSPVFQRLGLEWLPRLLREPRRLWRRTFVSAPIFVWHLLRGARARAPK